MLVRLLCLIVMFAPVHSYAQIRSEAIGAFNAALGTKDPAQIEPAATALIGEAIANPSDPNATVAAFEAAFRLVTIGEYSKAIKGAEFTVSQPASANPPVESRLMLSAYAKYKSDPKHSTRRELDELLDDLVDSQVTSLSVIVYNDRFKAETADGNWSKAGDLSELAYRHFEPNKDAILTHYLNARLYSGVMTFARIKKRSSHELMAVVNAEIRQARDSTENDSPLMDSLDDLYWTSEAWLNAIEASLASGGISHLKDEDVEAIRARFPSTGVRIDAHACAECGETIPQCSGGFDMTPPLKYPRSKAWEGTVGAMILKLAMNDQGQVTDVDVLAAVPINTFEENTIETVMQWTWDRTGAEETCKLANDRIILPVSYTLTY